MSLTDEQCRAMRTWADKTAVDTIDALRTELSRKDAHIAALKEVVEAMENRVSVSEKTNKYLGGVVHGLLKALDDLGFEADFVNEHDNKLESLTNRENSAAEAIKAAVARLKEVESQ